MQRAWKQVVFCAVILNSVFNSGYCQSQNSQACLTLDDCFDSTEFSQLYFSKYLDPSSPYYVPNKVCEDSDPVKIFSCEIYGEAYKLFRQNDAICGQVISKELITGPRTKINEFPWMALLEYTNGKTIETFCQGALISELYVVSSANCITRTTNGFKLTSVRLGEWDTSTHVDCDDSSGAWICNNPPVVVPVEKITLLRSFYNSRDQNNIGLIHLKHKVGYTDYIKPICVPGFVFKQGLYDQLYVGRKFEVASWGETSPVAKKSEILLKVDLQGYPCQNQSDFLCVLGTRKRNVCDGDEGAPIMGRATVGNRTYVFLAGIVTTNNSCGTYEGPIFLEETIKLRNLE